MKKEDCRYFMAGPFVKIVVRFFLFPLLVSCAYCSPNNLFGPKYMGCAHVVHSGDWTNWTPELQATILGNSFLDGNTRLAPDLREKHGIRRQEKIAEYRELGMAALYGPQVEEELDAALAMPIATSNPNIRRKFASLMIENDLMRTFFVSFPDEDLDEMFSGWETDEELKALRPPFDGVVFLFGYADDQRAAMSEEADKRLLETRAEKGAPLSEEDIDRLWAGLWGDLPFIWTETFLTPYPRTQFGENDDGGKVRRPPVPVAFNFLMSRAAALDLLEKNVWHPAAPDDDSEQALAVLTRFVESEIGIDEADGQGRKRWEALAAEVRTNQIPGTVSVLFSDPRLSAREEILLELALVRLAGAGQTNDVSRDVLHRAVAEELSSRSGEPQADVSRIVEAAEWVLAAETNPVVQLHATRWVQQREKEQRQRLAEKLGRGSGDGADVSRSIPSLANYPPDQRQAIARRVEAIVQEEPDLIGGEALAKAVGYRLSEDLEQATIPLDEAVRMASEFLAHRKRSTWDCGAEALARPVFEPLKNLSPENRDECLDGILWLAELASRDWPNADLYALAHLVQMKLKWAWSQEKGDAPQRPTLLRSANLLADALHGVLAEKRLEARTRNETVAMDEAKAQARRIVEERKAKKARAEKLAEENAGFLPDGWTAPDGARPELALAGRLAAKEIKVALERNGSHFRKDAERRRKDFIRLACGIAEDTGIPVFEVHSVMEDIERAFREKMMLPSPEEEAHAIMKQPLQELEERLLRRPDLVPGTNAVRKLAATWSESYGVDPKWFLDDLEQIVSSSRQDYAELEACRLAREENAGHERNRASSIRLLARKASLSDDDAARLFDSALARWREFRRAAKTLRDEVARGEHPEALGKSFAEDWAACASEQYGLPQDKVRDETEASVRKGLEEWRDSEIRSAYDSWKQAGIEPGMAEKEETAHRIAEKTGVDEIEVIAKWNNLEADDTMADLSHTFDKAMAGVNLAIAKSVAQTESALAEKKVPSDADGNPGRNTDGVAVDRTPPRNPGPVQNGGGGDGSIPVRAGIAVGCLFGVFLAWRISLHCRRRRRAYDVFISYRRESGTEIARALQLALKNLGYRVFFDYSSLQDGKFNEKIFDAIQTAKYFVLILTDGALDRCANDGDWVRVEIERALSLRKPIVPVCPTGNNRTFPTTLPTSLESLRNIQISELNMETLFEESVRKIAKQRLLR